LKSGAMTRAQVLLAIAERSDFAKRENSRSIVLFNYFGYLHRNPDDPPDNDLHGFDFWVKELETSGEIGRMAAAFTASGEYQRRIESEKRVTK